MTNQEVAAQVLAMEDDRFFDAPPGEISALTTRLSASGFTGLALSGPRLVPVERRVTLPLVVACRQSMVRAVEVPRKQNTVLVSVDAASDSVLTGTAYPPPPNRDPLPDQPPPSKPTGLAAAGVVSEVFRIDARAALDMPWAPGHLALTLLWHEWKSNTVKVQLAGAAPSLPFRLPVPSVAPEPAPPSEGPDALPTFLPRPKTPAPPEQGLALAAEAGERKFRVHGTLAVRARRSHFIGDPVTHIGPDGREHTAAVVVPLTLLLLQRDRADPYRFDLGVPVYGPPARSGETIVGHFSLDALAMQGMDGPPSPCVAYGVLDGSVLGPYVL